MRLGILDHGHSLGNKVLFAIIRIASRQPVPAALKLIAYRPDFFGNPMKKVTHEAMRGPSAWSVGDRELMAAYVSKVNQCDFCIKAHAAVSARAYGDEARVAAVLADRESAPIDGKLRATLRMLAKLAREHGVDAGDMRELLDTGVTRAQIEDALAVAFSFEVMNRLADAFEFEVPGPALSRRAQSSCWHAVTAEIKAARAALSNRADARYQQNRDAISAQSFSRASDAAGIRRRQMPMFVVGAVVGTCLHM